MTAVKDMTVLPKEETALGLGVSECEACQKRELYVAYPRCTECDLTVCGDCHDPRTRDTDYDHDTAVCKACQAVQA